MRKQDTWITRWCREQCQVHAGEEDHARPEWTTSRRGQDPSGGVNQNERERTGINGESTSIVWPTSDRRRLKNRTGTWHEMATELIRDWQLGVSPLSQKTPERQHSFSHAFPWLCKEEMRFLSTTPCSGSKLPLQPWFCMSSLVFLTQAVSLSKIARLLPSTSTIVIVVITQLVSWYSFYRPTEGGGLSPPRHCSKKMRSPCQRLYIAINTTVRGVIRTWVLSHRSQTG